MCDPVQENISRPSCESVPVPPPAAPEQEPITPAEGDAAPAKAAPRTPASPADTAAAPAGESSAPAESAPETPVPPAANAANAAPVPAAPAAPLYTAAAPAPAPPLPRPFFWAALVSYPLAYFYTRRIFFDDGSWEPALLVFSLLFMLGVELFARALHRRPARETPLWAAALVLLPAFMLLHGWQAGGLSLWQTFGWHMLAIWYAMARCGMLAAGASGSLLWLDALSGLFVIPWSGFLLRLRALWQGVLRLVRGRHSDAPRKKTDWKRLGVLLLSVAAALGLCVYVWGLLGAADANFAALGGWVWRLLGRFELHWHLDGWILLYFLFSLPVGAWLFGLVGGSLRREAPPCPADRLFDALAPLQKLPGLTVYIIVGALCAVYGLFFATQAAGFAAAALPGGVLRLTAPSASQFAVDGFWELCRVLLLDFALLAVLRFFGPALLQKRAVRALAAVFCLFGIAFAALAGVKLGVYIHLFAFTPRRVLSGWFVGVLLLWAVLALLWVLGIRVPWGHARLGVYAFVTAFLLLSAVNMDRQIIRLNIGRCAAGRDAALDISVLLDCGFRDGSEAEYTAWLAEAGWFEGRTIAEIRRLYPGLGSALHIIGGGTAQAGAEAAVPIGQGDAVLHLTFRENICTAAQLEG